ncbi:hypothetical protein Nepgr_019177 [Nepenthes gracilis]|uniref:Uncharacterized protein n=1 Tax=Nepenthes gracilis TaxID=150966 RepID=A0AAD3SUS9_NEPGR|nr:hypothetical protein Nepgr_019177 [Nepenthes gracilis]
MVAKRVKWNQAAAVASQDSAHQTALDQQQEVLSLPQNRVDAKALEEIRNKMEAVIAEAQQYKDQVFNLEFEL